MDCVICGEPATAPGRYRIQTVASPHTFGKVFPTAVSNCEDQSGFICADCHKFLISCTKRKGKTGAAKNKRKWFSPGVLPKKGEAR